MREKNTYFYLKDGKLCCDYMGKTVSELSVCLEYRGDYDDLPAFRSGAWTIIGKGRTAESDVEGVGKFQLKIVKRDGLNFQASLFTAKDFKTRRCNFLSIDGVLPVRAKTAIFNDYIYTRVLDLEMQSPPRNAALMKDQKESGPQYIAFQGDFGEKRGYYGYLGFTTFNRFFGGVSLSENGEFSACAHLDFEEIRPGDVIRTDNCCFYAQYGNKDVLSIYGKHIAKDNRAYPKAGVPSGWCSWYYYGGKVTQESILENMEILKREKLPVKYIQIDAGWQVRNGDWEENSKFPMGMKALAADIKEAGFIPGIWIAPFHFEKESKPVKEHGNDWFVRNDGGEVDPSYLIDYSVKEAREWLFELGRKISVEWGYRYIKVDLISGYLAINGYKKHGFNGLNNFCTMMRTLRSAVTEDTMLLSCTSPLGASAGYADCLRVSDDIFEKWSSLKLVAKQVLRRYFTAEYIRLDPDCLMVRLPSQHDSETFRLCTRNEREIRTFVTFMSAAGGTLMLSDKLSLLDRKAFDLIKVLFPLNEKPAKPLDFFERDIPSVLSYGEHKGVEVYALFNWEDVQEVREINFKGPKYLKLFYANKIVRADGKFALEMSAHDSEIVYAANDAESFEVLTTSILP